MVKVKDNLTNKKFGRLTVLQQADDHIKPNGVHVAMWECLCECGNKDTVIVSGEQLRSGRTQSCGCLQREKASQAHKKYNKYDLTGEYGIGWTSNTNKKFYFDLEDYDKIKNYCWLEMKNGYIMSRLNKTECIYLHRIIMNASEDEIVDHKGHCLYDNRKEFLRVGTQCYNMMNVSKRSDNTSGITGVWYFKERNKWVAEIIVNQVKHHIGIFSNKDDAIAARKHAEREYFGEWSYDVSMEQAGQYKTDVN